jgi:hypothetical protein
MIKCRRGEDYNFDLTRLNDENVRQFLNLFKQHIRDEVVNLPPDDYVVRYKLRNGNWRSVPLDIEVFNKLFSTSDRDASTLVKRTQL